MNRINLFLFAIVAAVLVALIIPSGKGAGSGQYRLSVHVTFKPAVQGDSIRFAKVWTLEEAEKLLEDDQLPLTYVQQMPETNQRYHLLIPYSYSYEVHGFQAWFGEPDDLEVKHPNYLIVEFKTSTDNQITIHRKMFRIPEDRKENEISITLR